MIPKLPLPNDQEETRGSCTVCHKTKEALLPVGKDRAWICHKCGEKGGLRTARYLKEIYEQYLKCYEDTIAQHRSNLTMAKTLCSLLNCVPGVKNAPETKKRIKESEQLQKDSLDNIVEMEAEMATCREVIRDLSEFL